jgi:hypothetical protein
VAEVMVRDGTWTFDGEIVRIVRVVTGGEPATTSFGVDALLRRLRELDEVHHPEGRKPARQ